MAIPLWLPPSPPFCPFPNQWGSFSRRATNADQPHRLSVLAVFATSFSFLLLSPVLSRAPAPFSFRVVIQGKCFLLPQPRAHAVVVGSTRSRVSFSFRPCLPRSPSPRGRGRSRPPHANTVFFMSKGGIMRAKWNGDLASNGEGAQHGRVRHKLERCLSGCTID